MAKLNPPRTASPPSFKLPLFMPSTPMEPILDPSIPPIVPRHDLGRQLRQWTAGTADIDEHLGGFRIRVTDTAGFPWGVVFAALLRHEFRVYVNRRDADLVIEASA